MQEIIQNSDFSTSNSDDNHFSRRCGVIKLKLILLWPRHRHMPPSHSHISVVFKYCIDEPEVAEE